MSRIAEIGSSRDAGFVRRREAVADLGCQIEQALEAVVRGARIS
jgi:hypothetical protein